LTNRGSRKSRCRSGVSVVNRSRSADACGGIMPVLCTGVKLAKWEIS
jgi:hypothetical protein